MTSFSPPGRFIKTADGFAPPAFGGTLALMHNTVAYTDTTAKTLFTLPAGAVPVAVLVNVTAAFDDTGTDLLDIGITGDANYFADNLNVASAGQLVTGMDTAALYTQLAVPTAVTATYTGQNGDAAAGTAVIGVWYYLTSLP